MWIVDTEDLCKLAGGLTQSDVISALRRLNEHSRESAQQRCTNHKTMNVIDKLPKAERPDAIQRLRAIW